MEASADPDFNSTPAESLPLAEIMDINAELDRMYGLDKKSDEGDELAEIEALGPEIELSDDQVTILLLGYLGEIVAERAVHKMPLADGWYKDESKNDPRSQANRNKGIFLSLSEALGIPSERLKAVVEAAQPKGLVEVKLNRTNDKIYTNIRLLEDGWDIVDNRGALPEDAEIINSYLMRMIRYKLIPLRPEIVHERDELDRFIVLPAFEFRPWRELQTLDDLKQEYERLRELQRLQVAVLNGSPAENLTKFMEEDQNPAD